MEPKSANTSNVDVITGPSTSSSEGQQIISENKPEQTSSMLLTPQEQDHNNLMPDATTPLTNDQTNSQLEQTSSEMLQTPHEQDHNNLLPNATTPLTNDQTNSEPEQTSSVIQDHNNLMPNVTTTHTIDQTNSQPEQTSPVMEKGFESPINSHLEAPPSDPFGDLSPLANDPFPPSLLSPQQQENPFLLHTDHATNTTQTSSVMQQENEEGITNSSTAEIQDLHSSFSPSAFESSPVDTFQLPTNSTTTTDSREVVENLDHEQEKQHNTLPLIDQDHWSLPRDEERTQNPNETLASSSSQPLEPLFSLESAQVNELDDAIDNNNEEHNNIASINMETTPTTPTTPVIDDSGSFNPRKKIGSSASSFSTASDSSTQDQMQIINPSSNNNNKGNANLPPKSEKGPLLNIEYSDDDIPISSMPNHGQQPSTDVASSSSNRVPSNDFANNKAKTQWSTASNDSLFSIQMGNSSNDMAWLNKTSEMDNKPSDMNNASQNNHPPLPLPPQLQQPVPQEANIIDISQNNTEQHEGVTEEKAAETMREVIMENSVTTGNTSKEDLTKKSNMFSKSYDPSNPSGSTKSFAFKASTDKDKTPSSKRGEERRHQKNPSQPQNLTERPAAAQKPKSGPNASQKRWLCCFTCRH